MQLLNRAAGFTSNIQDLKSVYLTYVRSVLEQSAAVWHSSLSSKNKKDLERVQKAAVRVILQGKYKSYKKGLKTLNIQTLENRRESLCLKFAKNCLKNEKVKNFFPKSETKHCMKKRKQRKFKINQVKTQRYKKSAIPYMQSLLNKENNMKRITMNNF